MDTSVFLIVIASAAFHASWNALLKVGLDRFLTASLMQIGAGALALLALPLVSPPSPAAWPWLGLSALLHIGYIYCLSRAYHYGELSQVYAIARGSAPFFLTLASLVLLKDSVSSGQLLGLLLLVSGIWLMALRRERCNRQQGPMLFFSLMTAVFIAGYSFSDGLGARANHSALGYSLWLFAINGVVMSALLSFKYGAQAFGLICQHWRAGLGGGALSMISYSLVIWAMTQAPIALVGALRETSVVFALLLGVWLLKEPLRPLRLLACLVISAGVMLMKLA